MTPQERELLEGFLANLAQTPATNIDGDAEALITRAVSRQPHGPYVLVQQALLQQIALHRAQIQIDDLQRQLGETRRAEATPTASFLGGALEAASQSPPAGDGARGWNTPRAASASGAPAQVPPGSGWSDFLRSAASTATGVAGGALLFQGLESLLGRHAGLGFGSPFGNATPEIVESTTVIDEPDTSPAADNRAPDALADAGDSSDAGLLDAELDQGDWDDSSFDDPEDDASWT